MNENGIFSKKTIIFIIIVSFITLLIGVILILLGYNMTFTELYYNNEITTPIFSAITFLGDELGLIILVIAVLFAYDKKFGKNLTISLLLSIYFNGILKDIFQDPLPYTREDQRGYGFPSGHAQNAVATWGYMAYEANQKQNKIVPWIFSIIIYLIAISRIMIGAHDIQDVVGGLLFGIIFLVLFIYVEPIISEKINTFNFKFKLILAILIPIVLSIAAVLIFPNSYIHYGLVGGALMGISVGYLIEGEKIQYDPSELSTKQRVINLVIGTIITLSIYMILRFIPFEGQLWEFIEFFIISIIAILLAPWIFTKIKRQNGISIITP